LFLGFNTYIAKGGTIQGSLNLPAQSLYPTIPTLYSLVSNSNAKFVIWYCGAWFIGNQRDETYLLTNIHLGRFIRRARYSCSGLVCGLP
jgi:hypothetical protein